MSFGLNRFDVVQQAQSYELGVNGDGAFACSTFEALAFTGVRNVQERYAVLYADVCSA